MCTVWHREGNENASAFFSDSWVKLNIQFILLIILYDALTITIFTKWNGFAVILSKTSSKVKLKIYLDKTTHGPLENQDSD
jgi:hypothetical protein